MIRYILLFLLLAGSVFGALAGTYAGGDGSAGNPAQIANATQLNSLMDNSADWVSGYYFVLTANIDMTSNADDNPIGSDTVPFNGNFDGAGYTLTGVGLSANEYVGLFGFVGPSGIIHDLTLSAVAITLTSGGDAFAGGLCGYNQGLIYDCVVSGASTITAADYYVGLLCGCNMGMIRDCTTAGTVDTTQAQAGGFVGCNGYSKSDDYSYDDGVIFRCSSTATVNGTGNNGGGEIGGFVGNNVGTILSCHCSGTVTGGDGTISVGGFAGIAYGGLIANSYSTSNVTGHKDVGGFIGETAAQFGTKTFRCCYATGTVTQPRATASITAISGDGATVTVTAANNFRVGYVVTITGTTNYNEASKTVTTASTSQFTYSSTKTGDTSTGTATEDVANSFSGGFIGMSCNSIVDHCYATGTISCESKYVGGFIGHAYNQASISSTFTDCYTLSNVTAYSDVAGFIGSVAVSADVTLTNCYAGGTAAGTTPKGFQADSDGTLATCYYDSTKNTGGDGSTATGLTTAQMKTQGSFTGFTFAADDWYMPTNDSPKFYFPKYGL